MKMSVDTLHFLCYCTKQEKCSPGLTFGDLFNQNLDVFPTGVESSELNVGDSRIANDNYLLSHGLAVDDPDSMISLSKNDADTDINLDAVVNEDTVVVNVDINFSQMDQCDCFADNTGVTTEVVDRVMTVVEDRIAPDNENKLKSLNKLS